MTILNKALDLYLAHPNRVTEILFLVLLLGAMALAMPYFAMKGLLDRAFSHPHP